MHNYIKTEFQNLLGQVNMRPSGKPAQGRNEQDEGLLNCKNIFLLSYDEYYFIVIDEGPPKPYVPPSEQQVFEPKKYTGANIPSRSFKLLQAMTQPENAGKH